MMEIGNLIVGFLSLCIAGLGIINGWLLMIVKSLQATDARLAQELSAIRLLVAGAYLTRDEFNAAMATQTASIMRAIDKIETRVEGKADRERGH